jgi:hypothetical protein
MRWIAVVLCATALGCRSNAGGGVGGAGAVAIRGRAGDTGDTTHRIATSVA